MINLDEIRKLSVAERVQLAEDIWDTIPAGAEDYPLTPSQKTELDRRLALLQRDPQGRPWREVLDQLPPSE